MVQAEAKKRRGRQTCSAYGRCCFAGLERPRDRQGAKSGADLGGPRSGGRREGARTRRGQRIAAIDAVATTWTMPVAIRVNGVEPMATRSTSTRRHDRTREFVVLPRAISAHLVHEVGEAVNKPVLAIIETAAGVLGAAEIAPETAALIAGTNDLRSDLRLPLDATREPISASLQIMVLAARCRRSRVRRRVQSPGRS